MLRVSSLAMVNLVVKFDSAHWTSHRVTSLTDCERHYLTSNGSAEPGTGVGATATPYSCHGTERPAEAG